MSGYSVKDGTTKKVKTGTLRAWQICAVFFGLLSLGLLVGLIIVASREYERSEPNGHSHNGAGSTGACSDKCPKGDEMIPLDPDNPSVFQDLTIGEMIAVREYLLSWETLNLRPVSEATVNSTYLYAIDLHVPSKEHILKFLDMDGPKPERAAIVVLIRGDTDPPKVEEFIVGPLPSPSWHKPAPNTGYNKSPIPFDRRPYSDPEYNDIVRVVNQAAEYLDELLVESYGAGAHNCTEGPKCVTFKIAAQLNLEKLGRQSWYIAFRNVEGFHLHPLGLEILIYHVGNDVSTWKVSKAVYNGQMFDSVEELMDNYRQNSIEKLKILYTDTLFSTFRQRGEDPMKVPRRGPRTYEPDGHRYTITGQHVEYNGWSFDFRLRSMFSMQLFDIKFKGERIVYEIGLQELVALYSGYGPNQISTQYLDSAYILFNFELAKGVDCPHSATYIDSYAFFNSDRPFHRKNAVCIFEYDNSVPVMRHYSNDYAGSYHFYGGINGYGLVVRSVVTNYNYDYVVDYIFYNSGVIQVREAATGYLQANFKYKEELNGYSFPISDYFSGTVHHHLFSYKVDIDVKGEKNRFATLDISTETIPHPWYPGYNVTQTRFDQVLRSTEMAAAIEYTFEEPKYYVVYNEISENRQGSKQGYRLENTGMTKFLLPDEGVPRSVRWAKYQLAVTKYKINEPSSTSIYSMIDKQDPIIDFDSFIADDESIVDEDLVLWVTMGTHHIPIAEDIPSVFTTGGWKSFYLRPFNYFNESPTVASKDTVHIVPDGDSTKIEMYGQEYQANCAPVDNPFAYDGRY